MSGLLPQGDHAQAEHVRALPQGPLGPPAPRGSRVEPRGARAEQKRAPRAAQAVPGGEALSTKMGDAHAEHAPEGLVNPAVAWATLGAHVVTARGARRACGGGGVSVPKSLITGTPTKQFSSGLAKRGFENPVPRTRNVRVIIVGPRKGRPAL